MYVSTSSQEDLHHSIVIHSWAESAECRAQNRRVRTPGGPPSVPYSDPDAVGASRGKPIPAAQRAKSFYTLSPAKALCREGRPVRPWREAHSLSPCPDGQRQRLRTRKPDPIARVLHPRSDNTRCCPADSSWACPPGSWRIDVYSYKVPARPKAKSALQGRGTVLITSSVLRPTVPWDCCWDRNWQFCTDGYLREG